MDVPELTNFGSLVRYALNLEEASARFYDSLAAHGGALASLARDLADQHRDRRHQVEQARQRFLNEVILEPISTLDGRRYMVDATDPPPASGVERAVVLEQVGAHFYEDAAEVARNMLAEAVRTFRRLAEGNAQNAARLRGIGVS